MTAYPEHEKMAAVKDRSQVCGEFLEWLREQWVLAEYGFVLCGYCQGDGEFADGGGYVSCVDCEGSGHTDERSNRLWPIRSNVEQILARYFGIDLEKIAAEKDAMYRELRERAAP